MKTMKLLNALGVGLTALYLLMPHAVTAQHGVTPPAELLRVHGIDTSEPSLLAALRDSDPQVRSSAAAQLAQNRDVRAIPAIEKALSTETDTQARIAMGAELARMGDAAGPAHLESMCSDANLSTDDVVRAERQLAMAHDVRPRFPSPGKCADVILAALETVSASDKRRYLLTTLASMVHEVPSDQATRMIADAQNLLADPDGTVRLGASQALADMRSTASIDAIRKAIQNEPSPDLRAFHQHNLDTLLKLQQSQ
jgi:HEAT repeat protein